MLNKKALAASLSAPPATYVEDVFSTYLYKGINNGDPANENQTITNGIDLAGEGGLVWIKRRDTSGNNLLHDSAREATTRYLSSNTTNAQANDNGSVTSFNSNGFTVGDWIENTENALYASWTFRKAEKFFDVVTYTGNGTAGRTVSHNLGSVPGCIIVKCTSEAQSWAVYHRSLGNDKRLILQTTAAATTTTTWNSTDPTSTVFSVDDGDIVNKNGATYVAYLFAHDAGGFGDSGSESVIKCGSYTGNGSTTGPVIDLGWEPQWLMIKNASATGNWLMFDNMRGVATGGDDQALLANLSNAESNPGNVIDFTATGFKVNVNFGQYNGSGNTITYIAIRRGPMKTPEAGTEVFAGSAVTTTGANLKITNNINMASGSLVVSHRRDNTSNTQWFDNLRGSNIRLKSNSTDAEDTLTTSLVSWDMDGFTAGTQYGNGETQIFWSFRRAPGFMDVVCYTGDGAYNPRSHNLTVPPELIIVKRRNNATDWDVLYLENPSTGSGKTGFLNLTNSFSNASGFTATSTTFTSPNDESSYTYVAYLFATLTGVSKVGSYTGNGSSQTINCGFTGGARFVLLKATSTTGDWVVFDSARGIVSGSDPYLLLNSTAAEVTNKDAVDTDSTGFIVNETSGPNINTNGVSYIYLAIS